MTYGCHQELPIYVHQLRVLGDLLKYQEGPTFSYFHLSSYTHDDLNMPLYYDQPVKELISDLSQSGSLNDTFFIVLGDHGYQRGENKFMSTKQVSRQKNGTSILDEFAIFNLQGKIEDNMPAFMLLPPTNFASDYPDKFAALQANAKVLT